MVKISRISQISAGIVFLLIIFAQIFFSISSSAVVTDGSALNWTREKAEHLARRSLIGPTNQMVNDLYNAGSATAAVNILFPDQTGPDRTAYDNEFSQFTGSGWMQYVATGGLNYTNYSHMYRYYQYRYARDPYEAKMKLFSMFEDIFSVNVSEGISFRDLNNLYDLIYNNTLGNYKTLLKKTLLNNPVEKGDYTVPMFLNNIRNWDKNSPNENYSRELLQLMMMGEYKPGESKDIGSERNYSEEDVAALARILTGLWSDSAFPFDLNSAATEYFTGTYHNRSTAITFLPGSTGSAIFPFYSGSTDTLNLLSMETSISGNNGVGDNTIDYIFAKRSHAIALFLADKLFRFYINESPSAGELEAIANQLESNNFEMLPTVKWLLTQDMMYSDNAVNAILYKNPIELSVGLFKTIHANDPATLDYNFYAYDNLLSTFGWNPYIPGSIFGRDGFDYNYKWFSGYTEGQWVNFTTRLMSDYTRTGAYLISNIVPITTESGSDITMDRFIEQAENNLYLGRRLGSNVKNQIKTYLTTSETGATISFQPNLTSYRNIKFPGVFALMLSQPEYILKSGYDNPTIANTAMPSRLDSASGNLIIIELPGGYDWLNGIIKKDDYAYYNQIRTDLTGTTIANTEGSLVDIGDYYMNPFLAYSGGNIANGPAFKSLLDDGSLKIFNRVGTSSHARDHLQAQNQMVSIDNTTVGGVGLIGDLTRFESNALNTVVLGASRPKIYQAGNYINLGPSDNRMFHANPGGRLNPNQKNQLMNSIMGTLSGRTYPGKIQGIFTDAIKIHNVANLSVASGGSAGVGNTTKSQLSFAKTMLAGNIGKIFYLANTGNGYDTHINELTTLNLNGGIGYLAQTVTEFFNQVKSTEQLTIVIYSEFGRTIAMNGTAGTDHGQGGGMFVISNDPNIQSSMTGSFYGNSNLKKEKNNWMSPGIDYRSVYGKVLGSLFGIPEQGFFKKFYGSLENDISLAPSSIKLLRTQYRATSDTQVEMSVKYKVEDKNFDITKGSYSIGSYGTGINSLQSYSQPFYLSYSGAIRTDNTTYARIVNDSFGTFTFNPALSIGKRFTENTPYVYTLEILNNQLNSTYFTGTTTVPEAITASVSQVSLTGSSILRKYDNKTYSGTTTLTGSGVFIKNNTGTGDIVVSNYNGLQMTVHPGITQGNSLIVNSGSILWNGGFILGETINPMEFIPKEAIQVGTNIPFSNFTVDRLIRVGADTLGINIMLNQGVSLTLSGFLPNTGYLVMSSVDGYNWTDEFNSNIMTNSGGAITFSANHLSLFAIVKIPSLPVCSLLSTNTLIADGSGTNLQWSTLYADNVTIDQGIGAVGFTGNTIIIPATSSITHYTLSASNINGSTTCNIAIESRALPTCTISAVNSNIKVGTSTNLIWTGTHVDTSIIEPWNTTAPSTGKRLISPTANTPYSLEISNSVGSGSCNTFVTTFPNTIPVANSDNISVTGSTITNISVLDNDADTDSGDTLTINTISTNPLHGIASISGDHIIYVANSGYCGSDTLEYTISDNYDGISLSAPISIVVNCIPDTTAPVIVLVGSGNMDITQGSGFIDPGASCTDNVDPTCTVTSTGTPNTGTIGTYTIVYSATDVAGNTSTINRTVNVILANISGSGNVVTSVTYTGITITSTGSSLISGTPLNFNNGSSLNLINSNIIVSSLEGSIYISGSLGIHVSSGIWNATLEAPLIISKSTNTAIKLQDQGVLQNLPQDVEIAQNVYRQYTHTIVDTYKAGGNNTSLSLSGANALMTISVSSTLSGKTLQILRSEDGNDWDMNNPDNTCLVDATGVCSFYTNHFSYFGIIDSVGSITINIPSIMQPSGGGGGIGNNTYQNPIAMNSAPKNSSDTITTTNLVTLVPNINSLLPAVNKITAYRVSMDSLLSKIPSAPRVSITPSIQQNIYALFMEMWRDTTSNKDPQYYKDSIMELLKNMKNTTNNRLEKVIINSMIGNINKMVRIEKIKKNTSKIIKK